MSLTDAVPTTTDPPTRVGRLFAPLLAALARPRPSTIVTGTGKGAWNHELRHQAHRRSEWGPMWRAAAEGCDLSRDVIVAAGITAQIPRVVAVHESDDGPETLVIELLPGQLPVDVLAAAPRLAPALHCARVRVTGSSDQRRCRLELLDVDPLAATVPIGEVGDGPALIGHGEDGQEITRSWASRGHQIVQGQTGSGKSVFTYGQLADAAARPDHLVCGIDPTGLLWRPFIGSRHAPWQVSGVGGDLVEHVELLERLCAEMDRRIGDMPPDRDSVEITPELPLMIVCLEEYAGLLRVADTIDTKLGKRIRAFVARLLAEGRKAGIRAYLIVQRADASVVDGLVRAQCATRVSFSVDSQEAVRMLHPNVTDPGDVMNAPPGVGMLTMPGHPLVRFRASFIESYGEYVDLIARAVAV